MALDLATDDISTLEARTEGWITGLQMAALSLTRRLQTQGSPGVAQFIATFSGSHRFVLDYLSVFTACVRYYAGPRAETMHFLSTAEQALVTAAQAASPDGDPAVPGAIGVAETQHIRGHIAALRAYLALQEGDFERTARQARQALNDLPSGDYARATSAIALAESRRGRGELTAWAAAYRRALAIARESVKLPMAVSAATYLADQLVKQGRLREAEDGYRDALRLATGSTGELLPAGGLPLVKLGELLREWNDLTQARQFLVRGIHLCQKWGHTDSLVVGYVAQARTALAAGDVHEAMDALQKAAGLVGQTAIDPWTACLVDNLRLRLWLAETDIVLPGAGRQRLVFTSPTPSIFCAIWSM